LFAAGAAFAAANVDPAQLQSGTSLNTIGPELLASHLRSDGLRNAMVSSPSLFYALSVLALGTDGASQELLDSRLLTDPDASLADIAPPLAAVLSAEKSSDSRNGVFRMSQSLWSANGASDGKPFVLSQRFLASAESLYGARHWPLDFRAAGAARVINDWAKEQTRRLIPAIIDDNVLSTLDWVILNTTLFEGTWGTAMQRVGAEDAYRFINLDGSSQSAVTIRTMDYAARVVDLDDGSVVFQLPFSGGKYAFIVHMPAPDQADVRGWLLNAAVPGFAGMAERVIGSDGTSQPLSIRLPAFAFSDTVTMSSLSPLTRDLGLAPLFERGVDLSRLSEQPSRVGIIKQDTRIELDEKGVRAAAATLVGGARPTTVRPSHRRREIVVDRPFAFAIVERASRALLFNGVLLSPPHPQAH